MYEAFLFYLQGLGYGISCVFFVINIRSFSIQMYMVPDLCTFLYSNYIYANVRSQRNCRKPASFSCFVIF